MKKATTAIPKYELKKFRRVHRLENIGSDFGYNNIDPKKVIEGFEIYSSEGLVGSIGPLKSEFYRISITVEGSLDMQIGLDHYKHQPRTLSFTYPNQIFSKNNIAAGTYGYYILFAGDFLREVHPCENIACDFPFYDASGVPVFQIADNELSTILGFVNDINTELQQQRAGREKAIKMYLFLLLLEARRSYDRQGITISNQQTSENFKLINRFRKLVSQHFLEKRQVNDYAELLGVSPNHLNRTVKENTGHTASEAIREMLIQEAKSLLRYTDSSVAQIAYQLDFSDPASFNRFFKTTTQETPLAFRTKQH